jgi:hypothetical protein
MQPLSSFSPPNLLIMVMPMSMSNIQLKKIGVGRLSIDLRRLNHCRSQVLERESEVHVEDKITNKVALKSQFSVY